METSKAPFIPPALLNHMADLFETSLSELRDGDLDPGRVGILVGQARVIAWMRREAERQKNNPTILK